MGQALGRVLRDEDLTGDRGPDGRLRVRVHVDWLAQGARVSLRVPRMLACATCDGGGCDGCGRSGAVVTRGRKDAPEHVDVRLPKSTRPVIVRLPRRGGVGDEGKVRGLLLVVVAPGHEPTEGVTLVAIDDDAPSQRSHGPAHGPRARAVAPPIAPHSPSASTRWAWALLAAAAVAAAYGALR